MGIYKHVQNICKDDKDGISYVVLPKIINSDVSFQLMFGRMVSKEPVNTKPVRDTESIRVADYYENY